MLSIDMKFQLDDTDPYDGKLFVNLYVDGIEVAWLEEARTMTEDLLYMIKHPPQVKPLFLKRSEGIIKLHWDKWTASDLVFAVYLKCTPDNWWQVLEDLRSSYHFSDEQEGVRE